jgi:hypothetical protein
MLMSNIVYYAYHGIRANGNRKDAILRNLPYLGIAGVGIGSAIFHATLKNYTQWCKYFPSISSALEKGMEMGEESQGKGRKMRHVICIS